MKYFLYRHIRKDTRQPFYIGIGTKNSDFTTFKSEYERAFIRSNGRSEFWKKIVKKYGIEVQIIFETETREEIFEKEIEFIKLYGRKDNGTGILANLTDGGDFNTETVIKNGIRLSKEVYQIKDGIIINKFPSAKAASKSLGIIYGNMKELCNSDTRNYHKGYVYCYAKDYGKKELTTPIGYLKIKKPILRINNEGNIVNRFRTIQEAEKVTGVRGSNITKCCRRNMTHKGYVYIFEEDYPSFDLNKYFQRAKPFPILQYDLEGTIIREWTSVNEARVVGGHYDTQVMKCLKGEKKTYHNSIFKYKQ